MLIETCELVIMFTAVSWQWLQGEKVCAVKSAVLQTLCPLWWIGEGICVSKEMMVRVNVPDFHTS